MWREVELGVQEIEQGLLDAIVDLRNRGYSPVVFFPGRKLWSSDIQSSGRFQPESGDEKLRGLVGKFADCPLFERAGGRDVPVLIVDLQRVGDWRQFTPRTQGPSEVLREDTLLFSVEEYRLETAREIIAKQPDLFRPRDGGQVLSEEEAIRELCKRVRLRILEQFEFDITDSKAGFRLKLQK